MVEINRNYFVLWDFGNSCISLSTQFIFFFFEGFPNANSSIKKQGFLFIQIWLKMRNFKLLGNQKNESNTPINKKRSLGEIVCYNPNGAIPNSRQHASNLRKPQFSSLPYVFYNQKSFQTSTRNGKPPLTLRHNSSSSNLSSLGQQEILFWCFVNEHAYARCKN